MGQAVPGGQPARPQTVPAARAYAFQVLVSLLETAVILFVGAGTIRWPAAWAFLAIQLAAIAANWLFVFRRDPQLLAERGAPGPNVKRWDRLLAAWVGDGGPLTLAIVAALDRRWGWSPPLPPAVQAAALLLVVGSYALWTWAMASNHFFSKLVRIQTDRGHTVVTGGPYRWMRHPGYAASLLYNAAPAIGLGSLWALLPACLTVAALVARTVLEDCLLHVELPGYREYAMRVRYRLIPGVW